VKLKGELSFFPQQGAAWRTFLERVLDVLELGGDELDAAPVRAAVLGRVRQALLPHDH